MFFFDDSPNPLQDLIHILGKLPGLGQRSARRMVLYLLQHQMTHLDPLIKYLGETRQTIKICDICGGLDFSNPCRLCTDPRRDSQMICVVETVGDLWAMERTKSFQGRYHVLGGVLSALDGCGPEDLRIHQLVRQVDQQQASEVILALNATVESQMTVYYLIDCLKPYNVKVTQLAQGLPLGGELDYLDEGTLSLAFSARKMLNDQIT